MLSVIFSEYTDKNVDPRETHIQSPLGPIQRSIRVETHESMVKIPTALKLDGIQQRRCEWMPLYREWSPWLVRSVKVWSGTITIPWTTSVDTTNPCLVKNSPVVQGILLQTIAQMAKSIWTKPRCSQKKILIHLHFSHRIYVQLYPFDEPDYYYSQAAQLILMSLKVHSYTVKWELSFITTNNKLQLNERSLQNTARDVSALTIKMEQSSTFVISISWGNIDSSK